MSAQLVQWHAGSHQVLVSIRETLDMYKARCDMAHAQAAEFAKSVETVRATLRAQHDAAEGGVLNAFDGEMEFEDKLRKSGRTKGKHGMGLGPRK
jgi:hypothetical protein